MDYFFILIAQSTNVDPISLFFESIPVIACLFIAGYFISIPIREKQKFSRLPIFNSSITVLNKTIGFSGMGRSLSTQQYVNAERQDRIRIVFKTPNHLYNKIIEGDIGIAFYKEYKGEFHLIDFQRTIIQSAKDSPQISY